MTLRVFFCYVDVYELLIFSLSLSFSLTLNAFTSDTYVEHVVRVTNLSRIDEVEILFDRSCAI